MSLLTDIDKDLVKALKAHEKQKVTVLRGLKSDLKYRRIDKREELTSEDIVSVLSSCAKKCRESVEEFKKANREDLVKKEQFELEIIKEYLPEQLSKEEVQKLIRDVLEETGADSTKNIGLVMQAVMPKLRGRADGKMVNKIAMEMLAN
ncbi:MAG: GatB/YqeY domain-containing protein [candidate division Zixibacteria bacterium]|nr:GatB/YqeY domain-containing protein [candidate division Zixibacteria bacterium]